jgi:ribosomal protein L29
MTAKAKGKNQKKDLAKQTLEELKKLEEEARTEWFKLRMDLKTGKLKDVHQAKKKRKEIAKIKTFIRMKQLERRK